MRINITDQEKEVLLLVIEDTIDQLDMDNLDEVHALNNIKDKLQGLDDEGFPLCPKYGAKVLPDENDLCSLCGDHSASKMYFDNDSKTQKYYNLAQLKAIAK